MFKWEGKNRQGTIQKGELAAKSKDEVMTLLRRQNILPISVSAKPKELKFQFGSQITDKDIVILTRQLATMIDAGLPLVQCLEILGSQSGNPGLSKVIIQVRSDVESGSTFAEALRKHPKVFDNLYVNMVAAGEAGGILDTILQRLATYMEKLSKIKRQIKSAMIYPSVILFVAIAVVSLLLVVVVPMLAGMFAEMGQVLPLPTRIVLVISAFLKGWGGLISVLSIVVFIVGLAQWRKTQKGLLITDAIALKIPVMGVLIQKVSVAKFTRTLGTLISSGVPIMEGLLIVARTAGNKVVEDAIVTTRQSVSEGKTLAEPLTKAKVFPPMVTQMIAVGEATGALDNMLGKIADFYDDEVDAAVAALTSMLEPMLMIFLGITVGFVIVAMYMPIFQMGALAGG
ncbi:MAG: pilus assembly protein PilC [Nitrospirae bacterium GWC2_57_13]|nr:MAG: pilus assembly protein PilC [Nitrospirae bacterium GWC2_57_13]HAR43043.1 pilus assembly protein PilC [Bdellovibrionales bacterium]HAS55646.1 pilus assembly protein PilC [Nitrospiraceae bacterium]